MSSPNDKRVLLFGGSVAIQDPEVIKLIKSIDYSECLWNETVNRNFCEKYRQWIDDSKTVIGLDLFKYSLYSNGTSEAFEMFYIKNKNRRFRCFKGEYVYHKLAWRNDWPDWKFIEDEKLDRNDAVVISLPFSDTGNKHEKLDFVLANCSALGIPVLIDCAYFGTCSNIQIDLSSSCITDVVFSLSKTFPVANARIGIRFSKKDDDDLMFVYDKINYNNRLGAHLGLNLINSFRHDFISNKYRQKQNLCCKLLDVTPSNTVTFGLDLHQKFPEYNRGCKTNRLGFYKLYTLSDNEIKESINASTNT